MDYINAIQKATTANEIADIVEAYLVEIGEYENVSNETYVETAARLGGDEILKLAETRWFEIEGYGFSP